MKSAERRIWRRRRVFVGVLLGGSITVLDPAVGDTSRNRGAAFFWDTQAERRRAVRLGSEATSRARSGASIWAPGPITNQPARSRPKGQPRAGRAAMAGFGERHRWPRPSV